MTDMELLKEAEKYGILDMNSVRDMIEMSKRDKVRKMHNYKISQSTDGRFQTMVNVDGKRKNIKARTEQELLDKLVDFYFPDSHIEKLTFHDLYGEWLEYKRTVTESPNTIKRHQQHYNKYFQSSVLDGMRLKKLDELTLEMECNRLVKEYALTSKEFGNVKTILNGMMRYAVRRGYISYNYMDRVTISVKYRQVTRKSGKTEVYNTDELRNLNSYLDKQYNETGDVAFLAVRLNFLLGLRVGELVALRWTDWEDITHLHIVREEVRDQIANKYGIVEHTKTHRDRYVDLVPRAIAILQKIPQDNAYIFHRNGTRVTARQIAYILEKYAERQGVKTKSTHKMRKTYASMLATAGVPIDKIRELLGHSDVVTTERNYIFNPLTEEETYAAIAKAL